MTRFNTWDPKMPFFWWLYLQPANVCSLPIIALCLKKETVPRKKPITLPLWVICPPPSTSWSVVGRSWCHPTSGRSQARLGPPITLCGEPRHFLFPTIVWLSWEEATSTGKKCPGPPRAHLWLWGLLYWLDGLFPPRSLSAFPEALGVSWSTNAPGNKGTHRACVSPA